MERVTYGVKEFAAGLGVSRGSVYTLIREKKIKSVVIQGRRLIPVEELKRLVDGAVAEAA